MKSNIVFFISLAVSFLPFILFAFLNTKANVKKEIRHRQYIMPVLAIVYSAVLLIFLDKVSELLLFLFFKLAWVFDLIKLKFIADAIRSIYTSWGIYIALVLFNTAALLVYIILKRIITAILAKIKVKRNSFVGSVVELFYSYDEEDDRWFIKGHYGQARTFIKTAYYGCCFISAFVLFISCGLCLKHLVSAPFYPVFAVIVIGEMAFFIDGLEKAERKSELTVRTDNSQHIVMYPFLRKPLKALFGDKLAAEGTTVNNGAASGGAIEDILSGLEKNGGHIGRNYAMFIRRKMEKGLKPNVDYVRCGYDLASGKSLLFNTPFYDKLNPYVFYAMNRELLTGGKVLIILGRHGTEEDLRQWTETGMKTVSNIPELWKISVLDGSKMNEDTLPDIGIITRSGVHDLDVHKNSLIFLRKVSFVFVVEPSKLVTTAQIGLNLLVKCCGKEDHITFCSVDSNCDGLVDALSHILMTNITEVSATEYPHGMSSYMYWTADDDYLQHRILPGVSRFLGMGTELSMVALKNQVKKAVWYGGEAFPVLDAHWIAKQYYYDLLTYAQLPGNQETFDNYFQTSFNLCNERVNDYSFITVEDDKFNLFETRRNFATIAEQQGFVNVISSEYMLREYMASNTEIFTADPKAIPYITADYARSKRNAVLSLCLLLCIDSVQEEALLRQLSMLNLDTKNPIPVIWNEICTIFGGSSLCDKKGIPMLSVKNADGDTVNFERDATILFKREYSIETGKFESVYAIENPKFARIILDDLKNATYIAEQESKDVYIGTELKGHVYQKYLPGQFFTLNGKYYEMVSTTTDNCILLRRASEHIGGRLSYRQVRNYTISHLENSSAMGALKTVNNIDIHYLFADFSVETPGYWRLRARNDFDNGYLVNVNGVPTRDYHHKQILKLDFSRFEDAFTDEIRMTLTNLLNEVFVTLFADNQPYISAVTPGSYDAPLTYSLELSDEIENADKCIFIIEDSQLDIGLLIAVERNINRIFNIIADYLNWNEEKIAESMAVDDVCEEAEAPEEVNEEEEPKAKKGIFGRFGGWMKGLFKKKDKKNKKKQDDDTSIEVPAQDYMMIYGKPHKKVKGKWVACSQEEFDKKMAERHRIIDEKKQEEKEAKAAAKAEAEDVETVEDEIENVETVEAGIEYVEDEVEDVEPVENEIEDVEDEVVDDEPVEDEIADVEADLEDAEADEITEESEPDEAVAEDVPNDEPEPETLSERELKAKAKADKKAAKAQAKADKKAAQAQAKADKKAAKEQAKADKKAAKEQAKADKKAAKAARKANKKLKGAESDLENSPVEEDDASVTAEEVDLPENEGEVNDDE